MMQVRKFPVLFEYENYVIIEVYCIIYIYIHKGMWYPNILKR